MRTNRITLFYKLTQSEVYPPSAKELERKEEWIKGLQKTVEADHKPLVVRVDYTLFNPEIRQMQKFFNGVCVMYYAIQNHEITEGEPPPQILRQYRTEILDEMLGYDVKTVNKVIRERKSSGDFKTVQAWNTFLKQLEETMFEASGYEFPDSEEFWKMVEKYGYDEARRIAREGLQKRLKAKLKTP